MHKYLLLLLIYLNISTIPVYCQDNSIVLQLTELQDELASEIRANPMNPELMTVNELVHTELFNRYGLESMEDTTVFKCLMAVEGLHSIYIRYIPAFEEEFVFIQLYLFEVMDIFSDKVDFSQTQNESDFDMPSIISFISQFLYGTSTFFTAYGYLEDENRIKISEKTH